MCVSLTFIERINRSSPLRYYDVLIQSGNEMDATQLSAWS